MAYVTREEIEDAVQGARRLDEILEGRSDPDAYLAGKITEAEQYANKKLARGGYDSPLDEPVTDQTFKSAVIGLVIGFATIGSSNREPFEERMYEIAVAYFDDVANGKMSIEGGARAESPSYASLLVSDPEPAAFDYADPDAEATRVFGTLAPPIRRMW